MTLEVDVSDNLTYDGGAVRFLSLEESTHPIQNAAGPFYAGVSGECAYWDLNDLVTQFMQSVIAQSEGTPQEIIFVGTPVAKIVEETTWQLGAYFWIVT